MKYEGPCEPPELVVLTGVPAAAAPPLLYGVLTGVPAAAAPPLLYGELGIPPWDWWWWALNGDSGTIPGLCLVGIVMAVAMVALRALKTWFRFCAEDGLGREKLGGPSTDEGRLGGVVSE